ncbi:MAG: hypothetical protein IPJ69_08075 [Deltaproteobacteria bacterium]|nr:MAG: hypothetical protein IPJ69_08075 [Deltaproteobacteria bacterium]
MKTQSKKLSLKLKTEFPIVTQVIDKHIKKTKPHKTPNHHITHREVEKLKKWVHKIID